MPQFIITLIEKLFGASFRTAVVGFLGGLALILPQIVALLDGKPETAFNWESMSAGLALLGFGWVARDNKVTSEDVTKKG